MSQDPVAILQNVCTTLEKIPNIILSIIWRVYKYDEVKVLPTFWNNTRAKASLCKGKAVLSIGKTKLVCVLARFRKARPASRASKSPRGGTTQAPARVTLLYQKCLSPF
ncbi:hypothetical protein BDC45DRAFT_559562 [Circinella umbellata]|nr:hypothetical protein BDC45DRAFT_559562 [Circinella umbellata]